MKRDKSFDGIISDLTTKHAGNVHAKGIATPPAKSAASRYPQDVADLTSAACLLSNDESGQWVF
jgi:hypothetical protein